MRHYSPRTEEAYVAWIRRYIHHHGRRHPVQLGRDHVRGFLSSLAVNGRVSASTQNQALAALLFLYREVLGDPIGRLEGVARAKRPLRLPTVLSRSEVRGVLRELRAPRACWVCSSTAPGCGSPKRFGSG